MSLLRRAKNRGVAILATAVPALGERLAAGYRPERSEEIPWAPLRKPLAACTVALVTTAGVHHRDQQPFDMKDPEGDPVPRELDLLRPTETLMITHDYYDHTDAGRDINIVFPVDRLREMAAAGEIGGLARRAFGFMGHIVGTRCETLKATSAPRVASLLRQDRVDAVLLTPG